MNVGRGYRVEGWLLEWGMKNGGEEENFVMRKGNACMRVLLGKQRAWDPHTRVSLNIYMPHVVSIWMRFGVSS